MSNYSQMFPYRVELVGAWSDHPFISKIMSGSVVTINVINTNFSSRSGLASSTRNVAKTLWPDGIPVLNLEENSRLLFNTENSDASKYISGAQDHIGVLYPGITRTIYDGEYWPSKIENIQIKELIIWLETVLKLVPVSSRKTEFNPRTLEILNMKYIKLLCQSGKICWDAIKNKNIKLLGEALNNSYLGKTSILPATKVKEIDSMRDELLEISYGVGISGAGGGGYLTVISEKNISKSIAPKIRFLKS